MYVLEALRDSYRNRNNFYQNSSGDILTCYHNGEKEQIEAHEATCTQEGNTKGIRCSIKIVELDRRLGQWCAVAVIAQQLDF